MAVTLRDYNALAVKGARGVLLEVSRLLGEYRDSMVIVGGWVPSLIIDTAGDRHLGSIDVDIALDHSAIGSPGYSSIRDLLLRSGYAEGRQPHMFLRTTVVDGVPVHVEVDLLAGEYTGTGKSHRTQTVQDVRARKARGCDLAFKLHTGVTVDGVLPGGAKDSAEVLVATIVPFIVMKGMALHDRVKEKDAYDIYYCVKNYSGGIDRLGEEFRPFLANKLVKEGLKKIRAKFVSPEHAGPAMVADFMEVGGTEERELAKRDAFERISAFLRETGQ